MTLTQTAFIVKRTIVFFIAAIIIGLVSFIGYKIWYAYYLAHLPPVEEKPDIKFGLLPLPDFPKTNVTSSNFSYSLDTTTGILPKVGIDSGFEKNIKVYFVTQTFATLLSSERSKSLAEMFNITTPPEILSETKYKFTDKNKSLVVNLDNGNFLYTKEASIAGKLNTEVLNDDNKLVSDFETILSTLGSSKPNLTSGRTKVIFLKTDGNKSVTTQLRSEAEAIQISLWPAAIDKKSIFTADFNKSLVSAVVTAPANNLNNYLSLNFTYYPIDTSTFATYPTKSAEIAFEDLKNGKGIVVVEPNKPQVSITSIYLGYFLSENYQPYLQPIFIFEGQDFVAYVSAISEQFQSPAKQN